MYKKYVRILNREEAAELYEEFFCKNWNKITIDQNVLAWCEIYFRDIKDGYYEATVMLSSERVYASIILERLGFILVDTN